MDAVIWSGRALNFEVFQASATAVTVGGSANSSTAYTEMTTAIGASYIDNASVQTNAYRYNASNGAAIRSSGGYVFTVVSAENNLHISKLQIANNSATSIAIDAGSQAGMVVDKCIYESNPRSDYAVVRNLDSSVISNCLIVNQSSTEGQGIVASGTNPQVINCTIVALAGSSGKGIAVGYPSGGLVENCAIANFTTCYLRSGGGGADPTLTTNYTDQASPPAGFTNTAFSTSSGMKFTDITNGTHDLKIKSGSSLLDVGTTNTTYAATDAVGTARPQGSAYDVGAWELVVGGGGSVISSQMVKQIYVMP